nr:3-ketoacyl-CoA synthase 19-like [Ipomoea batatas]
MLSPAPSLCLRILWRFAMTEDVRAFNLSEMGCSVSLVSINLATPLPPCPPPPHPNFEVSHLSVLEANPLPRCLKFPISLIVISQPANVQLTVTTGNRHLPDHPHRKRRADREAEKPAPSGSSPVNANRWSFVSGRAAVSQGCSYGDRERERKRYRKSRRRESVFYREIAEREEQNGKKGASERERICILMAADIGTKRD